MPDHFKTRFPLNSKPSIPNPPPSFETSADSTEGQILQAPKRISSDQDWSHSAQELLDTLPRAWTKGLLYALVGLTAIGLPWASFSKVEETGSAKGRLEPQGKSFRLDAPVAGTVTRIHVKSGQSVKAGQAILELDAEPARHELEREEVQLRGLLGEQTVQVAQASQRVHASLRNYTLLQSQLTQDLNEVERYRKLWQQGVVPQVKITEVERIALQSRQALNQAHSELEQAQSELKRQKGHDLASPTTKQTGLKTEIIQTQKKIQSLRFQLEQRIIRAPVNGIVFEFPIERTGAVVQPSQLIAQVAPEASPLVLRAQLPSQESGFVKPGLPVKVKFDAYPFQDYGIVQGQLRWVSPNSKSAEIPGQPEVFEIEVALDRPYLAGQHRRVDLTPGQTAIAEVVIRQRRVIDFVLDPFKKLQHDGLKL